MIYFLLSIFLASYIHTNIESDISIECDNDYLTELNEYEYLKEYDNFIESYNRHYDNNEYWERYYIFKENLIHINDINSQNKSYKLGINNCLWPQIFLRQGRQCCSNSMCCFAGHSNCCSWGTCSFP